MRKIRMYIVGMMFIVPALGLPFVGCDINPENELYTVTFDADNGSVAATRQLRHGDKIVKPADPKKGGYGFDYWYNTATGSEWNFNTPVSADITLKAKWTAINAYTVTFDADNGTTVMTQQVNWGKRAVIPADPVREGYEFAYWFNVATGDKWEFNTIVTDSITLKARWTIIDYTVTLNADNGSGMTTQQVSYGGKAIKPANPSKVGCEFAYWFITNPDDQWDFNTSITGNITLIAKWNYLQQLTAVEEIGPYLAGLPGGATAANPVGLSLMIDLGITASPGSGWRNLLEAVAAAGKYVDIDLSACTMTGAAFDFDESISTGKDRITSIILPDMATSIPDGSFGLDHIYTLYELRSFSGKGLTYIGDYAFFYCTSLVQITLPEGLTSVGAAFYGCTSLVQVTLPEGLTSIGDSAFAFCTSLVQITIPRGLTSIGDTAFFRCTSLVQIIFPDGLTSIGSIGGLAFYECTSLVQITLPEGLTSIGRCAFMYCTSLVQITLPASLIAIDYWAFADCTDLSLVTYYAITPPIVPSSYLDCFENTHTTLKIRVPLAGIYAYKTDSYWKNYDGRFIAM